MFHIIFWVNSMAHLFIESFLYFISILAMSARHTTGPCGEIVLPTETHQPFKTQIVLKVLKKIKKKQHFLPIINH